MRSLVGLATGTALVVATVGVFFVASAQRYSSTNYVIDASVMNNAGGATSSTSYKLVSSAGESIVGNGASGSYKMGAGYVAQLEKQQTSSFQMSVQPAGLAGYYPFDETSGTQTADRSLANVTGNLNNTPTWGTGKIGQALTFNGTNQSVTVGSAGMYSYSSMTVSAWIKTGVGNTTLAVLAKPNNFYLVINWGKAAIYDYTSGVTCSDPNGGLADNTWHYIAATLVSGATNGSTVYLDGAPVKTCTWTPQSNTGGAYVGQSGLGAAYFNGSIDEVKLYSRALAPDEILAEYTAQASGVQAGVDLGQLTPGTPTWAGIDVLTTSTGVSSYALAINQNHDLQKGSDTIPAMGGTIATPTAWVDGTTKGLGFTIVSSPTVDSRWSSGANYAGIPVTSTSYYSRSGPTNNIREAVQMRLKVDTLASVPSGVYTNTVVITGTSTP